MSNYNKSKNKHKDHSVHKIFTEVQTLRYNKDLDIWEFFSKKNEYYYRCLTCKETIKLKEIDF